MDHSSSKKNRENYEMELAKRNFQYRDEKRQQLKDNDTEVEKRIHSKTSPKFCCWLIFLLIVGSVLLISYFVKNIKDEVKVEFEAKKNKIEQFMPKIKEETAKSIDSAINLYEQTADKLEETQNVLPK